MMFLPGQRRPLSRVVIIGMLTAASVCMAIFAFEVFLWVSNNPWGSYRGYLDTIEGADFRRKWEVVADLNGSGRQAVVSAHPMRIKPPLTGEDGKPLLPLGGVSNVLTVLCNETGRYVKFFSDKYGFNNPQGIWSEKIKIVAVGDSFTQGVCPPPEKHTISLIRGVYPNIINLASVASGPVAYFAALAEYGPALRPAVVLWFHFEGNDLRELNDGLKWRVISRYAHEKNFTQNLLGRQDEIDRVLGSFLAEGVARRIVEGRARVGREIEPFWQQVLGTVLLRRTRHMMKWTLFNHARPMTPNMDAFARILNKAKHLIAGWNGSLILVYLPQLDLRDYGVGIPNQKGLVSAVAAKLGIPFVDAKKPFEDAGGIHKGYYRPGSHYNVLGNRLVADTVLKHLGTLPGIARTDR